MNVEFFANLFNRIEQLDYNRNQSGVERRRSRALEGVEVACKFMAAGNVGAWSGLVY